ncbi:hypothetical protein BX616_000754 [Lobosporangium transversale]|nr:hypothetical protein BX616_000754 [Lobosporangium transversale]
MLSLRRALLALSIAIPCLSSIHAQEAPTPVGAMAFARVGNYFFVHSGSTYNDDLVQQFYALDLTKTWPANQPIWISLPPGPYNGYHTAGYSSDNKTFFTFGQDTGASAKMLPGYWLFSYDIATKTWTSNNPKELGDPSRRDIFAVTNPSSNQIYIIGGDAGLAGEEHSNAFNTYDVSTGKLTEIMTPSTGPQNAYTYAAVWVSHLSLMMMVGGQIGSALSQTLWMYNPKTGGWSTQSSTGPFDHQRFSHCAASNADGSLVAVFGGYLGKNAKVGDPNAYILNTATWTWTTVPYSGRGRGLCACTIVDDTFIVWGGFYDNPSSPNGLPSAAESTLLLSLSTQKWLSTYTPSPALAQSSSNPPPWGNGGNGDSNPNNSTDGNKNKSTDDAKGGFPAGAIGGIAAAAVIILIVGAFLFHRRNKKKQHGRKSNVPDYEFTKAEEGEGSTRGKPSLDGPPQRPAPPPGNLSPALYDFDSPPANNLEVRLSQQQQLLQQQQQLIQLQEQQLYLQQLQEQFRHSPEEAYAAQQQYLHSIQTSPQLSHMSEARPSVEGGYNSGYSSYSTPSAVPLLSVQDPSSVQGSISPYQQQPQLSPVFSDASNVYYPPPPLPLNQQQQQSYSPSQLGQTYPYKVPADGSALVQPNSPTRSDYHDTFGMKHMSIISDSSSTKNRRVSAPQGAYVVPSSPGLDGNVPHTIPE